MNFQELGLILQREREKKGFSIEVVVEATKISRINLVALENGDRSSLPHPVYTKGFVKSYARFLDLDANELSMIVDREYQVDGQGLDGVSYDVAPMVETMLQEANEPAVRKKAMWPLVFVVVVLIALIIFFVVRFNEGDEKQVVEVPASSEVVENPVSSAPESVNSEAEEKPALPEVADESESTEPLATPEATVPVVEPPKPVAEPVKKVEKKEVAQAPKPEKAEKPAKQKYDHVLVIRATTDKGCWIGVWKGDEAEMARDFVLKEGEPLRLMFNLPRRIRIGNAAGVSVTHNGKPYPLDSAKGNIQTLRFGAD